MSLEEAAVEVRRRLSQAVEARLISDVPLGAFLSGGIDSSSVVALMSQHSPGPVRTFTIGFDDTQGFDERPYARLVASAPGHVENVRALVIDAFSAAELRQLREASERILARIDGGQTGRPAAT